MKTRTRIISVLLLAAVAAGILHLHRTLHRGRLTVTSTGPLDIRLWGIRPNGGDAIYDPNGKKILDTLGSVLWDRPIWEDGFQRFDFIFELPETAEPPLFVTLPEISDAHGGRLEGSGAHHQEYYKAKRLLWVTRTFPRTYRKSILFDLLTVDARIDAIDLKLQYYHGPPGPALFTLKGPFKRPSEMTSDDGAYKVTFTQEAHPREYHFKLTTKKDLLSNMPVIANDSLGRRHFVKMQSWTSNSKQGIRATYNPSEVSFETLRQIAFDETPNSITFKNIRLDLGRRSKRSHAEYLDKMAERLDGDHSTEKLLKYRFKNANEAIKVIDVVRGSFIYNAGPALMFGGEDKKPLDPPALNSDQIQRLRQTLNRWTQAIDPKIREMGVRVGLFCKWPEFIESAFNLLDYRNPSGARTTAPYFAAQALYNCRNWLADWYIERSKEILLRQDDSGVIEYLNRYLSSTKSQARIKALRELADSDRTWLWWYAITTLAQWREFDLNYDSLPEKIKLRLFLVAGADGFSDPNQIAPKAYSLLPELLTPQLVHCNSRIFFRILDMLAENFDRKKATAVMIRYLRSAEDCQWDSTGPIERIVKYINLWYGLNIGALGSDFAKPTRYPTKYNWPRITAEAIESYENRTAPGDPNSPR